MLITPYTMTLFQSGVIKITTQFCSCLSIKNLNLFVIKHHTKKARMGKITQRISSKNCNAGQCYSKGVILFYKKNTNRLYRKNRDGHDLLHCRPLTQLWWLVNKITRNYRQQIICYRDIDD